MHSLWNYHEYIYKKYCSKDKNDKQKLQVECAFVYTQEIAHWNTFGELFVSNYSTTGKRFTKENMVMRNRVKSISDRYDHAKEMIYNWHETMSYEYNPLNKNVIDNIDKFTIIMDNLNSDLMKSFNTMPDRWSIVYKNKIIYKGAELPDTRNNMSHINHVDKFLESKLY
eukprot:441194_1